MSILALAVAVAGVGGVSHEDSDPAPRPKPLLERLAAGEHVKLTDEKGFPTSEPIDEPEHGIQHDKFEGYRTFSRNGIGIASLADEPLPDAYRLEADVAVWFQLLEVGPRCGLYVGRKSWPGLPFKHESAVMVSFGPELTREGADAPGLTRLLRGGVQLYWWPRHEGASTESYLNNTPTLWDQGGKHVAVRFARVRIDVRRDSVEANIDGVPQHKLTEEEVVSSLNVTNWSQKKDVGFPEYKFDAPAFGNGLGIYCRFGTCVIRNLTLSTLTP